MITKNIDIAIAFLQNDKLVGIPTETVYGLAGNAYKDDVVKSIYQVKRRPQYNPLILHISAVDKVQEVAKNIPDLAFDLAEKFWPGPLTLILQKGSQISDRVTAGLANVAVRVSAHDMTQQMLNCLDFPLVAPSANPFGSVSPTCAIHVQNYFKRTPLLVLDGGPCVRGIESTIVGFHDDEAVLYRQGSITEQEIKRVTGSLNNNLRNDRCPVAPGMLSRHYAPRANTFLTKNVIECIESFNGKRIALLSFFREKQHPNILFQEVLSHTADLSEAARNLYAALHKLDELCPELIIAERLPDIGLGKSINDKLERAAKNTI